jgi:FKBP-type peptidyl-prolyl cis-trans isomerase FkpA
MRRSLAIFVAILALAFLAVGCCPNPATQRSPTETTLAPAPDLAHATEDEKTLYIIGIAMGRSATTLEVAPNEVRFLQAGIADQVAGRPSQISVEAYAPKVEELAKRRAAEGIGKRESAGKAAIEAAAKEPGAIKTESGLVLRTLKPGKGESPTSTDKVKVHYRGTFPGGTVFDSDMDGEPVELVLAGTIPCWGEALQRMKPGESAKLVCPPALAYGDQGNPPTMPGHATLIFEIELLSFAPAIEKKSPADNVPLDLRAP